VTPDYALACTHHPQFGNDNCIKAKGLLNAASDCVEWVVDRLVGIEDMGEGMLVEAPGGANQVAQLVEVACHEDPSCASGFIVPWSYISEIDWDVVGLKEAECANPQDRQHAEAWQRYIVSCIQHRWREA
jgi:hypothetical protein